MKNAMHILNDLYVVAEEHMPVVAEVITQFDDIGA